jgi:hypothetical protein
MDDEHFAAFAAWFCDGGLSGQNEETMVTEFCTRLVADGLPLARGRVFIDTLHPVCGGARFQSVQHRGHVSVGRSANTDVVGVSRRTQS